MIGQFSIGGQTVRVNFTRGNCIAIPLEFAGQQPNIFNATPAQAEPMQGEGFVGDTRQAGPCNVPILTINPHCNGTHTESVAHIVHESVAIHEAMPAGLIPATLISLLSFPAIGSGESYRPALGKSDSFITATALHTLLNDQLDTWLQAVIIRTLPNHLEKLHRRYGDLYLPPFLSIEAIDYLISRGVQHLLVDIPSVDRMWDEGLLTVHHRFWNVPEGTHALTADTRRDRTITELIYVPDSVPDGRYLLDLQIPAFSTDAAPSRPWLYPVEFI